MPYLAGRVAKGVYSIFSIYSIYSISAKYIIVQFSGVEIVQIPTIRQKGQLSTWGELDSSNREDFKVLLFWKF